MPAPDALPQTWEALISELYPWGQAVVRGVGHGPAAGEPAASAEVLAFIQCQAVLAITERYLSDLHALWLCSDKGPQASAASQDGPLALLAESVPLPPLSAEPVAPGLPLVSSPQPAAAPDPLARPPLAHASLAKPVDPSVRFFLPNAKVDRLYVGKLEGKHANEKAPTVLDAWTDASLGLLFDVPSCEFRGVPTAAGEHAVSVRWTLGGDTIHTSECLLFVNPDPRSLWKQIEPPADDPYFKPNTDAALIEGMGFRIAAASRRGRSHAHVGGFRDDDFFVHHHAPSGWSLLIVADGAGSAKSARWGSKLAVAASGEHIASQLAGSFGAKMCEALANWSSDMASTSQAMQLDFCRLFQEASQRAVDAIETEAASQGVPAKDYATTLLAAAVRRDANHTFLAAFWLGDGVIAAYGPRGKVRLMGMPDSGEFAGQTRFLDRAALTDPEFGKRIVLRRCADLAGVVLMTDGISDPRFETDNGLADAAKWDALWDEMGPSLASSEPQKALLEWLHFFTPGHHDDRTLAVLW